MMTGRVATCAAQAALHDGAVAGDTRLRFASFVLFPDADVDEEQILAAVVERLEGVGAEPEVDPHTQRLMENRGVVGVFHRTLERVPLIIKAGGVRLTITVHPGGSEPSDWGPFADSELWPEVEAALARERAHVAIQETPVDADQSLEDCDVAFNRALAVTLAADAVSGLCKPLAVLWHPARHAMPAGEFARCLAALSRQRSPLRFWLALRREDAESGIRLRTEGLRPLAGREIEAEPSPFGALATEQMVLGMASYLVDRGGRVSDGAVVDGPRQSRIVVEDARSGPRQDAVWRLRTVERRPDA